MYETSLMKSALSLATKQVQTRGQHKIHRIVLQVGELSGVVPEALALAFETVSKGTAAEGAQLELATVPTRCYCINCRRDFDPMGWIYECPHCQRISSDVREGQALELVALEVS